MGDWVSSGGARCHGFGRCDRTDAHSRTRAVLRQIGELDAIVGKECMDGVGHGSEFIEE